MRLGLRCWTISGGVSVCSSFLDRHIEGGGEPQGHLCSDAELAYLVVRDDNLDDVDALGEFALTQVPQGAELGEALAEGQVEGLVGIVGDALAGSHDESECKGHVGVLLLIRVNYTNFLYICSAQKST